MKKNFLKRKFLIVSSVIVITIIFIPYYFFRDEIKYYNENYDVLDKFADTTDGKVYRFYFIRVSDLDSNFINYAARNTLEKNLNESDYSGILIAHFYRLEDTLELPEKLFEQMRMKYPNKKDVGKNLRYVIRGAVKTYFCDSAGYDATLFYNKLIVPRYGVNAKDVLK